MLNIQFKKGVLELCVLSLLERGDRYGYDVAQAFSERIHTSDGTVYPILRRLSSEGYVDSYISESSGGPARKYYKLTPEGLTFKNLLQSEWMDFTKQVNSLLNDGLDLSNYEEAHA